MEKTTETLGKTRGRKKGAAVNKSQEIRRAAREVVEKGGRPRPMEIVEKLAQEGIEVSGPQVSMALKGTGMEYRPRTPPGPSRHMKDFSAHDLAVVKQFLGSMGSTDRAMEAIGVYTEILGETGKDEK